MKNKKDLMAIFTLVQDLKLSRMKLCIKWRLKWALRFKFYVSLEEVLPLIEVEVLSAPRARPHGVALEVVEEVNIRTVAAA